MLIWWVFSLWCVSNFVSSYCYNPLLLPLHLWLLHVAEHNSSLQWLHSFPPLWALTTLGQLDVVLPLQMILRVIVRGSAGLTTLPQQQQPQSQILSQTYGNYPMGPLQVSFSLLPICSFIWWCMLCSLLSAFRFACCCHVNQWGSISGVCSVTTLQSKCMAGICAS